MGIINQNNVLYDIILTDNTIPLRPDYVDINYSSDLKGVIFTKQTFNDTYKAEHKCFYYCDEYSDNIPYDYTILVGKESLNIHYICSEICHYYNMPYTIYDDNNLIIREFDKNDFSMLYSELHNGSDTWNNDYMKGDKILESDAFVTGINVYALLNCGMYGVFYSDEFAGIVGINYKDNMQYNYYLSYYIKKQFRHNGLASKAINILLGYFYIHHERGEKIGCLINKDNIPSIKTALKCGFKKDTYVDENDNHAITQVPDNTLLFVGVF